MKGPIKIVIGIIGVLLIAATIMSGIGPGRGSVGFFLGLVLGGALLVSPFTGLGMLLIYIFSIFCIVGMPILGAWIGVQITGKEGFGPYLGLILGGWLGYKMAFSNFSDRFLDPIRKAAKDNRE